MARLCLNIETTTQDGDQERPYTRPYTILFGTIQFSAQFVHGRDRPRCYFVVAQAVTKTIGVRGIWSRDCNCSAQRDEFIRRDSISQVQVSLNNSIGRQKYQIRLSRVEISC